MTVAVAALSVVSGIVGAVGSIVQASAAASAAEANADIERYNMQVAERNRIATLQQAEREAEDRARANARTLASLRAAYGSAGLSLEGTTVDVLEDQALEGAYDEAKIIYAGRVRAAGYIDEANQAAFRASLHEKEAKAARTSGFIGAAGRLLGGATDAGVSLMRT